MKHDFEDIEVKENGVELIKKALKSKKKKAMIGSGSMSDPYMPLEYNLQYMRKILELIYRYGFGFTCITKSNLILRDLDLLKKINEKTKVVVQVTLTTFDEESCKKIEPNVCTTKERFELLKILNKEGIETVVWLCPILPFINDNYDNIDKLLDLCIEANVKGIICFGMGLTLRDGDRQYFYKKLDELFPGLKEKYIKEFKNSYNVTSPNNMELMDLFYKKTSKNDILNNPDEIFTYIREFPEDSKQATLF